MTDINFTEKELEYINACTIDSKGRILSKPSNPFPSLYRKGVISKHKDDFVVANEYRDWFYKNSDMVDAAPNTSFARGTQQDGAEIFTAPIDEINSVEEFEHVVASRMRLPRQVKNFDEFQLIDNAKHVYDFAVQLGGDSNNTIQIGTGVGKRKAWRTELSILCANFFACSTKKIDRDIYFEGETHRAIACKYAFMYLFKLGNRIAQRSYDSALIDHGSARGVYDDVSKQFLDSVQAKFKEWKDSRLIKDSITGDVIGEITANYDESED